MSRDMLALIENLNSQAQKHADLLTLLKEEGNAPTDVSLEQLEQFNERKKILLESLALLEQQRIQILSIHPSEKTAQNPSLEELLHEIPDENIRKILSEKKKELSRLINEIRNQNLQNRQMVRARKETFRALHEEITTKLKSTRLYSAKGQSFQTGITHLLNQRA